MPLSNDNVFETEKERTKHWFYDLQKTICQSFVALEKNHTSGALSQNPIGHFVTNHSKRQNHDTFGHSTDSGGGGGLANLMRGGRLFEKAGVNVSVVYGVLDMHAQNAMVAKKSFIKSNAPIQFWASGISVVAHMQNPHIPAIHMNTRMFWTAHQWWFGGGIDLNPCFANKADTIEFHTALKQCCDRYDKSYYPMYKKWADQYFWLPHRKRTRGVGGVFFDELNSGDWEADFAFTCAVGNVFLPIFTKIIERHRGRVWTQIEKQQQLNYRGLYTEYNLLYDRGTKFGLASGHDADAVLMSLPPIAQW